MALALTSIFDCRQVLAEEKVREQLNIGEFSLYMLPIDEDVISFELDLTEKVWDYVQKFISSHFLQLLNPCLILRGYA